MDVLEHLADPRGTLMQIRSTIGKDCVLVLSCPDAGSSAWRIMDMQKINPYWIEIEHHHNFSRARLASLLNECGFDIVDFDIPYRYKAQMEFYVIPK
jgi:2-polyprenyl-3-methyl-5-hydroxy-6-metoxy-1,4-benzoquinol methylase